MNGADTENSAPIAGDSAWKAQPGVLGANGEGGDGVLGVSDTGIGVHGRGGQLAGLFEGHVQVTGNIDAVVTGDARRRG